MPSMDHIPVHGLSPNYCILWHSLDRYLFSMERQARYAEVEVGGLLKGNGGRIMLGAGLVWSKGLVPKTLSLFIQEFPEVRVELSSAYSAVLVPMLIEGLIDIAVCEVAKDSLPKEFEVGKLRVARGFEGNIPLPAWSR